MREPGDGYLDLSDGGRLHYEIAGAGPVVTLLHPGLWDMRTWDPQFEPWTERFRVLRYDHAGLREVVEARRLAVLPRARPGRVARPPRHRSDRARRMLDGRSARARRDPRPFPSACGRSCRSRPASAASRRTDDEEAWWDERGAPIEAAARGRRLRGRAGSAARDLGAARGRRRGGARASSRSRATTSTR